MPADDPDPAEGDSRIALDIVREAGDWSALEPVEDAVLAAAEAAIGAIEDAAVPGLVPGTHTPGQKKRASDGTSPEGLVAMGPGHKAQGDGDAAPIAFEACIVLADDARVRELNRDFRGKDKPTNVLSFPAPAGPAEPHARFLGDIVLAVETLLREARAEETPPRHHLQHLVVHGLLHLLGYDHETETDAETMEQLEVRVLHTLGIESPYEGRELVAAATGRDGND